MRVFLIGMPASGKSVLAKKTAEKNKMRFFDTDTMIEEKYQMKITDIFKEFGEEKFRQYEKAVLNELLRDDDYIVATGGGLPCFFDNMQLMNEAGITVYLKTSVKKLMKRIPDSSGRPLLNEKNDSELETYLKETLQLREKYYLTAKYIIDTEKDPYKLIDLELLDN